MIAKISGTSKEKFMDGVSRALSALMSRTVQLEYSGQGRQMKGRAQKRNFSSTSLYKCLQGNLIRIISILCLKGIYFLFFNS